MKYLAELRRGRGLTQAMLAEIVGVDSNTISRYEKERLTPSLDVGSRIAEFFGVKVETLRNGPASNELEIVVDWEVKDVHNVAIGSNEAGFGYRANDDNLLFWGAIPATSDIDEVLEKIRFELAAAMAGRDAHRAAQGRQ